MKLYKKLLLGFLGTPLLLAVVGAISLWTNLKIETSLKQLTDTSLPEALDGAELAFDLEVIEATAQHMLLGRVDRAERAAADVERVEMYLAEFRQVLQHARSTAQRSYGLSQAAGNRAKQAGEAKELELLDRLDAEFSIFERRVRRFLELARTDRESATLYYHAEVEPRLQSVLLPLVLDYKRDAALGLRADREAIVATIARDNLAIITATIGAVGVASVAGLLMARHISRPVRLLHGLAERIGQGDFSTSVRLERQDELGSLARAFEQMTRNLETTMVSRSYLDVVLNSMADSLIVIDGKNRIQTANRATLELLQAHSEDELLGRSIDDIADRRAQQAIATLFQTSRDTFCEATYRRLDGRQLAVGFSISPLYDEGGRLGRAVCVARDATERRETERALRESEERYALIARATNDGLWDWDLKANQVYYSSRWRSMLGYADDEIGTNPEEWFVRIRSDAREGVREAIATYLNDTSLAEMPSQLTSNVQMFELEYPMQHREGHTVWMLCRGIAVRNARGVVYRLAGTHTDLTQRKQVEGQLLYAAFHDLLTELPNRSSFAARLQDALDRARTRADYRFAVLFLDLDRFKVVNDSLGHHLGDSLLKAFAERLQSCVRDRDSIARLGGDEFAVLLDRISEDFEAQAIANRIQKTLTKPFHLGGRDIFVSASIGIVTGTAGYECIEAILRDADTAMYQAKANGKARYAIFDRNMHLQMVNRLHLENDLRAAIEREEFIVYYQPIVDLRSGHISGVEALVRWQHPERGLVSPNDFVPIAEETGAIKPIGWWVLHRACEQLQQWQERFPYCKDLTISVNLSGKQFVQLGSAERVAVIANMLRAVRLEPKHLKLEITESVIIENNDVAARALEHLSALGINLAMDDFGTGYSSLSYLHRMQVHTLKIDRSFVNGIESEPEKVELVRAIVSLASALEMDVVAEGIETVAQQQQLLELGCTHGQGFLWAKPASAEEFAMLLADSPLVPTRAVPTAQPILPEPSRQPVEQ